MACSLMSLTWFSSFNNLFRGEMSTEFDFDLYDSIARETLDIFVFGCKSIGRSVGSQNGAKRTAVPSTVVTLRAICTRTPGLTKFPSKEL